LVHRLRCNRPALKADPCFHKFTFIEKDPRKVNELQKLRDEFSDKPIRIECGDANDWVQALCNEDWNYRRAVLFLDPFGMQVSWQTLEAVARTKCIDLWLLFPLGVAISRLLRRDGDIDEVLCQTVLSGRTYMSCRQVEQPVGGGLNLFLGDPGT